MPDRRQARQADAYGRIQSGSEPGSKVSALNSAVSVRTTVCVPRITSFPGACDQTVIARTSSASPVRSGEPLMLIGALSLLYEDPRYRRYRLHRWSTSSSVAGTGA